MSVRRWLRLPKRAALEALRRVDPVAYARRMGVQVGEDCRLLSTNFGSEPFLIRLGNRVEITHGVQFITHDGGVWVLRDQLPKIDVLAPICIEDHAFVGVNSILLPGVTVGHHAIVAAGSVVTRDVEPETVVAGVPARKVSSLSEYRERATRKSLNTKQLPANEKRDFLMKHFEKWRSGE